MSETRHYRGTLLRLTNNKEDSEATAKDLLSAIEKTELPSYHDNWLEYLLDNFYKEYVVVDDCLYRAIKEEVGDEDVFIAHKTKKGYKFEVAYYDGGMSFDEAIEEAIRGLE